LTWEEIRTRTSGLHIYLAEMEEAIPCWQANFRLPLAMIVGGEAEGASEPAREISNTFVKVPMPGGSESLIAAVAGAILMFEVVRQREKSQ
jgi:TrmH family RNA methyltransferase